MSAGFPMGRPASLRGLLAGLAEGEVPDLAVTGVEMDSRRVRPGNLFLACKGQGGHGLQHWAQARAQGAAAIAWEPVPGQAPPEGTPSVPVTGLSQQAGRIAARYYDHPSAKLFVVGITGTDGKTSTAHLVAQALERLGQPCAYLGTLGSGRLDALQAGTHTTPDPVSLQRRLAEFVEAGMQAVAMEVSSHALDQGRVNGVSFAVAVLTNIGRDHLDYHGDVARYAAAKHRLFKMPELRAAILNRDDAYGRAWSHECQGQRDCVLYGLEGPAAPGRFLLGEKLVLGADGLALQVRSAWGNTTLQTRLLGRFNAYNLLAALAVLLERGVPLAQACGALAESRTVPGRIEGFRGPGAQPLVVVDYAHTPQALEQILQAVRAHCRGRLWVVFGCGGDRDRGKRPLMGAAAARFADSVVLTDDNPRNERPEAILEEIRAGMPVGYPALIIPDRARAIRTAVAQAGPADVVVVAGKGHEDYQIYGQEVRPFSDRHYVAELVGATGP